MEEQNIFVQRDEISRGYHLALQQSTWRGDRHRSGRMTTRRHFLSSLKRPPNNLTPIW